MIDKKYKPACLRDCKGDLSKRWYIEFYIWNEDEQKLNRKRDYTVNLYKTKKERRAKAEELIKEINTLLYSGKVAYSLSPNEEVYVERDRPLTLYEAVETVYLKKKPNIKAGTKKGYSGLLIHLKSFLEKTDSLKLPLKNIKAAQFQDFFEYLKTDKKLSNKSCNNYKGTLSAVLNYLVGREELAANPVKNIRNLKVDSGKHVPYSVAEMNAIKTELKKSEYSQLWIFINFIYYCFIRPGELRLLKIENILEKTILIPAGVSKNGKGEHVVIPATLEKIIQKYKLRDYPKQHYVFTKHGSPGPTHVHINFFYEQNLALLKSIGLHNQDHGLYSYKHTGVINFYNACKDIKAVQKQCRHYSIQQTDIYLRDMGLISNEEAINFPEL